MSTILEEIRNYFKRTPREKVLKDWKESSKFDDVGPLIDDYFNLNICHLKPSFIELNQNVKFIKKYPNIFGIFFYPCKQLK